MATSKAISSGVIDKATKDAINGMLLGIVSGMTKEAVKMTKKMAGQTQKDVIGDTSQGMDKRGGKRNASKELSMYLRAQKEKNKFSLEIYIMILKDERYGKIKLKQLLYR